MYSTFTSLLLYSTSHQRHMYFTVTWLIFTTASHVLHSTSHVLRYYFTCTSQPQLLQGASQQTQSCITCTSQVLQCCFTVLHNNFTCTSLLLSLHSSITCFWLVDKDCFINQPSHVLLCCFTKLHNNLRKLSPQNHWWLDSPDVPREHTTILPFNTFPTKLTLYVNDTRVRDNIIYGETNTLFIYQGLQCLAQGIKCVVLSQTDYTK